MMSSKRVTGAALAAAAAMLFSTAAVSNASAEEAKIHCDGVNSCKGTSDCHTANNDCAGKNSCKGQGFKELTQAQCEAAKAEMAKEKGG